MHTIDSEIPDEGITSQIDPEVVDEVVSEEEAEREGADNKHGVPLLQSPLRVVNDADVEEAAQLAAPTGEFDSKRYHKLRAIAHLRKGGRIVMQIALIVAICTAGEQVANVLPIDLPSNIVSMIVLLIFLMTGTLKMRNIADGANFLLDHMSIFFIPAAVAIMGSFDIIAPNIVKLVLICLITTVLVFFVTSFTVSTTMNLMAHHEQKVAARAAGCAAVTASATAVPSTPKEGAR